MSNGAHQQFNIDGVDYLIESNCEKADWPRLVDKVIRHLERIGKYAAKDMCGHKATVRGYTRINNRLAKYYLTINPQGLNIAA